MGNWGAGLYANDTTCDVRDTYMELLKAQVEDMAAYEQTLEKCADYLGDQDEPLLWYALAECQWRTGRLLPEVKEKALWWIGRSGGVEQWQENGGTGAGWLKTLQKLKEKLESPMPKRKKIRPPEVVNSDLWEINDIYAYQFHLDSTDEKVFARIPPPGERPSFKGKYIVLQKIGSGYPRYEKDLAMRVQVYDKLFDTLPTLENLEGVRILPIDSPTRVNISHDGPIFRKDPIWMSMLVQIYGSKRQYPAKHLFYLGNKPGPSNKMDNDQQTGWNRIEETLCKFYLEWVGVEYDTIGDGIYDYVQTQK